MTEFMVIFGSEAESRPEWTRMVDVVYGHRQTQKKSRRAPVQQMRV